MWEIIFLFFKKRWYISNKWEKCHTRSWLDFKCPIIFLYSLDTNIQFILNCAIVCRTCNTILNWTNKFTNYILIVSLINSVNNLFTEKYYFSQGLKLGLLPIRGIFTNSTIEACDNLTITGINIKNVIFQAIYRTIIRRHGSVSGVICHTVKIL